MSTSRSIQIIQNVIQLHRSERTQTDSINLTTKYGEGSKKKST